jgi:SSS family solute:Na+ symporter
MNLHWFDWLIVLAMLITVMAVAFTTKKYTTSVVDFLAADRCAGRYLLCVSGGMAKMSAVAIVAFFEIYYIAGFTAIWWAMLSWVLSSMLALSGWMVYRYRETRALTLAQFFEMRYSRNFRVFSGLLAWVSGVVNFGIFPAVGARFFIYYCGLPTYMVDFLGLEVDLTLAAIMFVLLGISLYMVFLGGQITVMVTDFVQGIFVNLSFIVILLFFFWKFDWNSLINTLQTAPENASLIHPFHTTDLESFNFVYYILAAVSTIYAYRLGWQGEQGNNCSAKSAHEAKMAGILGEWRNLVIAMVITILPLGAYVVLHDPTHATMAAEINDELQKIGNPQIQQQVTVSVALTKLLPVGISGLLCASMLAAFIASHDTYMHSWGSIFIQDVVLPLRKEPLSQEQHLKLLRFSILMVAVIVFFFSLFFPQNEKIVLFMAISGSIFLGGVGAAIIGGLYWKHGSTLGAWAALVLGGVMSIGGLLLSQLWKPVLYPFLANNTPQLLEWMAAVIGSITTAVPAINWKVTPDAFPFDSQWIFFFTIVGASGSYVLCSLFTWLVLKRPATDMDRLLNRGKYKIQEDHQGVETSTSTGFAALIPSKEFTTGDRVIFYTQLVWSMGWLIVFVLGMAYNMFYDVPEESWANYWLWHIRISLVVGVITVIWFTCGGFIDMRRLYRDLAGAKRSPSDDGTVTHS